MLPFDFDFKEPDYSRVFEHRVRMLKKIRSDPSVLPGLKAYYKNNIAQFIIDWGCTSDPRNVSKGRPTVLPLLLFPKQIELCDWVFEVWKGERFGVMAKSREVGATWVMGAIAASICILYDDVVIGFGSRKAEYIDDFTPKCIFWKIRQFISLLPKEFKGSWNEKDRLCSKQMYISIPERNCSIIGEAGDNIGRGGRTSLFVKDEAAFFERPELIEASLSANTNCCIDVSTPHGPANPFARKYTNYREEDKFTFRWQDDPRKDAEWYEEQCRKLDDPVVIAQELDLDFNASVAGIIIPNNWVIASIDAHIKLGVKPTGVRRMAFDVADEGADKNAVCARHGILIEYLEEWSGKNSDIYASTEKVFQTCDLLGYDNFYYDADGLGASVRGDAKKINEKRPERSQLKVEAFRGSGEIVDPLEDPFRNPSDTSRRSTARTNEDYFANAKAQGWWALKKRFYLTFRAVTQGAEFHPDDIISIPSTLPRRDKLILELSQPTAKENTAGKMLVDKKPDEARSPNLADAVMIAFAPTKRQPGGFFGVQ